MRSHLVALAVVVLVTTACPKETPVTPTNTQPDNSVGVSVSDNQFTPEAVTIRPGEEVTWVWDGNSEHGLQFNGSSTPSVQPVGKGNLYVRSFDNPGVYMYYCPVHGSGDVLGVSGMSGRVTVQ
jgi:plastocyanin